MNRKQPKALEARPAEGTVRRRIVEWKRYAGQLNVRTPTGGLAMAWLGISGNAKQRRAAARRLKKLGFKVDVCYGQHRHQPSNVQSKWRAACGTSKRPEGAV